ncbi:MAG TPA: flagellar brake protein, partial [bacterium]|nr:flagellar brake protein [bacterium]
MPFRKKRQDIQEDERFVIEYDLGEGLKRVRTTVHARTDKVLKILAPLRNGIPLPLPKGLKMRASVVRDDALYLFDSLIIDREAGNVPVLVIPVPDELERVQRRQSYRLSTEIPVELIVPAGDTATARQRHSIDLSGTGLRIAGEPLPLGMIVHLKMHLPNRNTPIFAVAEVVRVESSEVGEFSRCLALKFV